MTTVHEAGDRPSHHLPPLAQVKASNKVLAQRLPDGDIEFGDGTRWSGDRYPDRDSLRTELERHKLADELMRIEESHEFQRHVDRVAVAMFGYEYGYLEPRDKAAVDAAMELVRERDTGTGEG